VVLRYDPQLTVPTTCELVKLSPGTVYVYCVEKYAPTALSGGGFVDGASAADRREAWQMMLASKMDRAVIALLLFIPRCVLFQLVFERLEWCPRFYNKASAKFTYNTITFDDKL
jgi:hypothetical protein